MSDSTTQVPPVVQRKTKQLEAIRRVITEAGGPLTIDEIHRRASDESSNLGIATVYRTIKRLLQLGEVRSLVLPEGETRYEPLDRGHHHHFRCRLCDVVYDLDICPLSIPGGTTLPGGFVVENHEVTLYGLCPSCVEK